VGPVAVLACLALVVAAAAVPASVVSRGDTASFVVAVWVLGLAEVVVLALLASPFGALGRGWLLAGAAAWCAGALVVGRAASVRPPPLRPALDGARFVLRDPALLLLAGANAVVLAYTAALAVFTPPGEDDAVTYHLLRSAFWRQEGAVAWIHDVVDLRANVSPPVSEIAVAVSMALAGSERFVAIPQWTALPVMGVAAYAVARHVGLGPRPAALGGLALPLVPVAVIQASTAMNDLVPAALAGAVALFVLRATRPDLVVAAVSVALMVGTKTASLLVVPSLALVAMTTTHARRWAGLAAIGVGALLVGSLWYLVNRRETGELSGGLTEAHRAHDGLDPLPALARAMRWATSAIELPGAEGLDRYLYVLAGAALLAVGIAARRRSVAWAGVVVAAVPLVLALRWTADEIYTRGWFRLGREDLSQYDPGDFSGTIAATGYTWYGPVGLVLVVAALVLVWRHVRRRELPRVALALASAPILALVGMAIVFAWNGAYGRLLLPAVVLSAAVWGVVHRWRAATVAVAVVSTLVAVTSLVWWNKKPLGLRLLEPARGSVWTTSRAELQQVLDGSAPFVAFVDRVVPRDARLAVAAGLPPYPLFGRDLSRTVRGLPDADGPVPADWLVVPRGSTPGCPSSWAVVAGPPGTEFTLFRRVAPDC
jgi:hypothetical protein